MSDLTIAIGNGGTPSTWYLTSSKSWFRPIDLTLLPGPRPAQATGADAVTVVYSEAQLDTPTLYFGRLLNSTIEGVHYFDVLSYYNDIKNIQAISSSAEKLFFDGLVHADVMVGGDSSEGSEITLNGAKRGNVITGAGDDTIVIRMANNGVQTGWTEDYRVGSGAGNDHITLAGLDIQAEIAAGDQTFVRSIVGQVPIVSSGVGRISWLDGGAGNDTIIGWESRDNIIGGTDTGTISATGGTLAPSGFAYSVGSAKGKGRDSFLYKIDLQTGQANIVGEVAVELGKNLKVTGLDMDSLTLNPKDGLLYGFATKLGGFDSLVKIDPARGNTTYISLDLGGFRSETQDMAFDKSGNLYFVSNGDFMKVDTITGGVTKIGNNTLDDKIGALAIDPLSDRIYGLAETGSKTVLYEINKINGKVLSAESIGGLPKSSKLEGMSFDSEGHLFALDRVSGKIASIDIGTHSATYVAQTLGVSQLSGDGFEALAIGAPIFTPLTALKAVGGDVLTGGAEADHFWYAAGDGVDSITDFEVGVDQLHISGFAANDLQIDVFNGNTYVRFHDSSADGFADNAMIELQHVTILASSDLVLL